MHSISSLCFKKIPPQPENRYLFPIAGVLFYCFLFLLSIILFADFKIALRVRADGAGFGGLGADDDMTAVAAFPNLDLTLFEDGSRL